MCMIIHAEGVIPNFCIFWFYYFLGDPCNKCDSSRKWQWDISKIWFWETSENALVSKIMETHFTINVNAKRFDCGYCHLQVNNS